MSEAPATATEKTTRAASFPANSTEGHNSIEKMRIRFDVMRDLMQESKYSWDEKHKFRLLLTALEANVNEALSSKVRMVDSLKADIADEKSQFDAYKSFVNVQLKHNLLELEHEKKYLKGFLECTKRQTELQEKSSKRKQADLQTELLCANVCHKRKVELMFASSNEKTQRLNRRRRYAQMRGDWPDYTDYDSDEQTFGDHEMFGGVASN